MSRLSAEAFADLDDRALHDKLQARALERQAVMEKRRQEQEQAAKEYARVYREQYMRRFDSSAPRLSNPTRGAEAQLSLVTEMTAQGGSYDIDAWGFPIKSTSGLMGNKAMGMGMGFATGMFVGGSVGLLHGFSPLLRRQPIREPIRNIIKRSVAGGSAFGVIFAMGSLFQ